jgi:hypothetical protein
LRYLTRAPFGSTVGRVEVYTGRNDLVDPVEQTVVQDDTGRIDVGRVDEIDSLIERAMDDLDRLVVIGLTPLAEHHRAEAQLADRYAGSSQWSQVHVS